MTDKVLHTVQLAMVLVTAVLLIIFAHSYLPADLIFTSMVAGIGGIVGTRIASNGYVNPTPVVIPPVVTPPVMAPPTLQESH